MIKVKYVGDISPAKVKVKELSFRLVRGDILELDKEHAEHLLINKNFIKLSDVKETKDNKVDKSNNEMNYDLDGDGDFDSDDVSLAAKVLSGSRKLKK